MKFFEEKNGSLIFRQDGETLMGLSVNVIF